jgi:serine protease Do
VDRRLTWGEAQPKGAFKGGSMRWLILVGALLGALPPAASRAADAKTFARLQAPAPMEVQPLPSGAATQRVKFVRAVIQLKPEPWARIRFTPYFVGDKLVADPDRVVTWEDGKLELDPSTVSGIITEELRAARVPLEDESLFAQESSADLMLGVRIGEMQAYFCQGCDGIIKVGERWSGVVVQNAHWELYSGRERKVLATVDTRGGFTAPKKGISGAPEQLIYGALRDNARRLIASEEFRRAVTGAPAAIAAPSSLTPISVQTANPAKRPIASSARSVAAVFTGEGHGTGFLISSDGYVLTNQHVVGGAKYVKVRWPDDSEVLGEVIRVDRRRDVALVKVDAAGRQPLGLRKSAAALGEAVYAIGTPLDAKFQGTVTKGIVSANRTYDGLAYIQSDVTVNGGNSGGPLLDESGAVIGITVSGMDINGVPAGLNLFIPIADALDSLALKAAP